MPDRRHGFRDPDVLPADSKHNRDFTAVLHDGVTDVGRVAAGRAYPVGADILIRKVIWTRQIG